MVRAIRSSDPQMLGSVAIFSVTAVLIGNLVIELRSAARYHRLGRSLLMGWRQWVGVWDWPSFFVACLMAGRHQTGRTVRSLRGCPTVECDSAQNPGRDGDG